MDVNPIGKNKIEDDCLYSPTEKKVIKPSKATLTMYAHNNKESAEIAETLMGDYGRILEHVPVTAHSYFEALLYQISRDRNKYKSEQLMQQIAYYMAKWPQRFYDLVRPYLGTHSYESYIKNIFHGTKFIDYEVITAVITKMWNLAITIVSPDGGVVPFYHQNDNPDIVLVCNSMEWPEKYFCATKPDNPNWRPIKGVDWSGKIRIFTNVKTAHESATKALCTRLVNKVVTDFNEVTTAIDDMKQKLGDYQEEFEKIIEKVNKCTSNMFELEAKQIVLRSKMIALGVDASTLNKSGFAIEGIHYTTKTTKPEHPSQSVPLTTASTTHSAVPPQTASTTDSKVDTSTTTAVADVHVSATTSASAVPAVSTASTLGLSAVSTTSTSGVPATPSTSGFSLPIPSTPANVPSTPAGPLSVGAHQAMSSGSCVVGGPQQILNIGDHNVLISGSGPSTDRSLSIRYGKILRGVHHFFCKCG